jgi:signal transduction histidine kinase
MSVVAVRSSVARVVLESQPDEARQALEIIEVVSRRAMHEMRLLVGVLRQGETVGDLSPAPGLADLPGLVAEIGAAGVPVTVHVEGQARPLPAGIDVSAFRIVQEALTNVVRHARPASAHLELRFRSDEVEIEVSDNGGPPVGPYPAHPGPKPAPEPVLVLASPPSRAHAAPPVGAATKPTVGAAPGAPTGTTAGSANTSAAAGANGSGHGLVGMRERVALFGGTFNSGPAGLGYRVLAVLPTDERGPSHP